MRGTVTKGTVTRGTLMSGRPAHRRAIALAAVVIAATSCGVSTGDDSFSEIPPDEIPFGLNATSTSTTTSTTTTTTTTPANPPVTTQPTDSPIRQEEVDVYFLSRGRLQRVVNLLPSGFSPEQLADVLEAGPPPDAALDTLIEEGLIVSAVESGGVLTVDLDPETFDRIASTEQTEAIAQIVLTMIPSLPLVGQVTFTLGGEPIAVKKGNSLLSEVGQALSFDDYEALLVSRPAGPTTATTTTMPPDTTAAP